MAAKTTLFDGQLLSLILNGTTIANIAINATSAPITNIYMSLHTASPGVGGNQTTNEAAYTSYARQAIVRTSSGFLISGATATLVANVNFPAATGGSETETYIGFGTAVSGAGELLYFGALSPTIAVSSGVTPQVTTGTTITES